MAGTGQAEEKGDGSMSSEDDNIAKSYLDVKMDEASVQFDITMHYVDQAILAERERCAQIAETCSGGEVLHGDIRLSEFVSGYYEARHHIAARIRSGEI